MFYDEFLRCVIDNSLLYVYPTDVNVSIVPCQGGVYIWNASFRLATPCPSSLIDRENLEKRIAFLLKSLALI